MANRRDTFAKRQREADLRERARAKQARRMAKRTEPRTGKGPELASLEDLQAVVAGGVAPVVAPPLAPEDASNADPADPAE
jgi:hypothetical protein